MSLERKILSVEHTSKPAGENLAINDYWLDQIRQDKADVVLRIYKHQPAVILGASQNTHDAYLQGCKEHGYDVVRRKTGGAAIVADEESALCYSLFCKPPSTNHQEAYTFFTIPLAQTFGYEASIEGTYYLKVPGNHNKTYSLAGHAIKQSKNAMQLDGIVHEKPLDTKLIKDLLNLRELYKEENNTYIQVGKNTYHIQDKQLTPTKHKPTNRTRNEQEELDKLPSLQQIGSNAEEYTQALINTAKTVFGNNWTQAQAPTQKPYQEANPNNSKAALGHCFIFINETEKKEVHYKPKP